jgi:hypothetical protein
LNPALGLAAEAIAHHKEVAQSKSIATGNAHGRHAGDDAVASSSSAARTPSYQSRRSHDYATDSYTQTRERPAATTSSADDIDPPEYTVTAADGTRIVEARPSAVGSSGHEKGSPIREKSRDLSTDESDDQDEDEDDWELDDAAENVQRATYDEMLESDNLPALTRSVLKGAKLPLPIILPQRRPRSKARDFVYAYSPVL